MALLDDIRTWINESAAEAYFGAFVCGPRDLSAVSRSFQRSFSVPKDAARARVRDRILERISPDRVLEMPALRAMLDEGTVSATRRQFRWTLTVDDLSVTDGGTTWNVTADVTISFTEVPLGT